MITHTTCKYADKYVDWVVSVNSRTLLAQSLRSSSTGLASSVQRRISNTIYHSAIGMTIPANIEQLLESLHQLQDKPRKEFDKAGV